MIFMRPFVNGAWPRSLELRLFEVKPREAGPALVTRGGGSRALLALNSQSEGPRKIELAPACSWA